MNKIVFIPFFIIVLISFLVRFYSLSEVPNGLQQDETSIGYNAFSILQTGKDEYGKEYPLYFKAFGEYKLPLSIYLTTGSFALLGVSEFSLRFPSALFGVMTVICIFFLARELFGRTSIALLSMGLMAINPWHIHFSRGAYEVTPALFFITLGVYLYIIFLRKNSSLILSLSAVSLALSMYSYNIARLFIPFLVLFLAAVSYKKISKVSKKKFILPLILFFLFLVPFILTIFTSGGYESTKGTLITSSAAVQSANLETRSYITEKNTLVAKILFNGVLSNASYYVKNIVSYFNADFFFVKGSLHGNHGIGNVGQFYIFELVFIIVGVVSLLRSKMKWNPLLFGWIIGVIGVASLTREAPHATRSFFIITPIIMISAVGLYEITKKIRQLPKGYRLVSAISGGLFAFYFIAYYFSSYFLKFPVSYAKNYRSEDKKLVKVLNEKYGKYDTIYIDTKADLLYTSILFYSKFDPGEFQKSIFRAKDDSEGFSRVTSFGKYQYIDVEKMPPHDNSLVISNREISGFKIIQKFNYPTRPVVIAKGQEIISFPVMDTAYVLLEKN